MKKYILLLLLALAASLVLVGCSSDSTNWLSPMISVENEGHNLSLWDSTYNLHRNETFELVFRQGDSLNDISITPEALIAGGAVQTTLRVNYGGDGEYMVRLVAFAYSFFDHGRPTRLAAHAGGPNDPNPPDILVLWM